MSEPRDRDPSRVGDVVAAKYRLDEELGRGGMGAVYRAYHLRVHKEFAIKILLSEVVEHRSIASRFFLEAQAAGRIGHPGILDVYDVGEAADGTPYIVMELLRGEPLSSLVRRERMDIDVACWIAMEVLDVLDAAHKNEIIHRDVKPQNVFLTERGGVAATGPAGPTSTDAVGSKSSAGSSERSPPSDDASPPTPMPGSGLTRGVKLLDFGVAKFSGSSEASALTRSGEIIGSPLYMAPEQAKGEADLDARADVWSVGAMLFEMLTGKCAHAATTPVAVLAKILTEQAPAPSSRDDRVPPELDAVVEKALRIDRKDRWGSAREMRDALDDVRKKRGTAGTVPILPPAPKRAVAQPSSVNDRTPGAITSTVAAPSDPPRRPWSSPPQNSDAKQTGARKGGGSGDSQLAATPTSTITGASAFASRSRVLIGAIAGIGAIVLVGWYITAHSNDAATDAATTTTKTAPPPTTPPTPPPPSTSPSVEPSATTSPSTTTTSVSTTAVPSASATATTPTTATMTAMQPIPAAPKCAQGEALSKGHCCARGLEWQGTRCERPLATTF